MYSVSLPSKNKRDLRWSCLVCTVSVSGPYAPWQRVKADHRAENQLEMQACVALQHFLCQKTGSGCTSIFVKHKASSEHVRCVYLCWYRSATHWLIAQVLFLPSWGRCPPGTYLTVNQETAHSPILLIGCNCWWSWSKRLHGDWSCIEHLKPDFFAWEHQKKPANALKRF